MRSSINILVNCGKEWFPKRIFYALDEPSGKASYQRMEQINARLNRLNPTSGK